jgi:hypothetical protein
MRPINRRLKQGGACLAAAGALLLSGACAGENIFTGVAAAGGGLLGDVLPPRLEITAPLPNLSVASGDSVLVRVNVSDNGGVREVLIGGIANRGGLDVPRFEAQLFTLPDVADTTLTHYLQALPDNTPESVNIIVEVTDTIGSFSSDSVRIIIPG